MPTAVAQSILPLDNDSTEDHAINKADFARQFIRSRAGTGATPADLMKGFENAGIAITKPYIYSLVQRLQKQNAIRKRRGKWHPIPDSEQSVNGSQAQSADVLDGGQ